MKRTNGQGAEKHLMLCFLSCLPNQSYHVCFLFLWFFFKVFFYTDRLSCLLFTRRKNLPSSSHEKCCGAHYMLGEKRNSVIQKQGTCDWDWQNKTIKNSLDPLVQVREKPGTVLAVDSTPVHKMKKRKIYEAKKQNENYRIESKALNLPCELATITS